MPQLPPSEQGNDTVHAHILWRTLRRLSVEHETNCARCVQPRTLRPYLSSLFVFRSIASFYSQAYENSNQGAYPRGADDARIKYGRREH